MRTRIALTAAVAALALVAVGCGGDDGDGDTDPTAAWASDFCTAITTWTDELQTVTSQFSRHVEPLAGRPRVGRGRREERDGRSRRRPQRARRARDGGRRGDPIGTRLALDFARDRVREHRGDRRGHLRPHRDPERDHGSHVVVVGDGERLRDRRSRRSRDADAGSELQSALEDSPECADISS